MFALQIISNVPLVKIGHSSVIIAWLLRLNIGVSLVVEQQYFTGPGTPAWQNLIGVPKISWTRWGWGRFSSAVNRLFCLSMEGGGGTYTVLGIQSYLSDCPKRMDLSTILEIFVPRVLVAGRWGVGGLRLSVLYTWKYLAYSEYSRLKALQNLSCINLCVTWLPGMRLCPCMYQNFSPSSMSSDNGRKLKPVWVWH